MSGSTNLKGKVNPLTTTATNLMFGAALHGAARQAKGLTLSPLEQKLVKTLRLAASEEEVAAFRNLYSELKTKRSAGEDISKFLPREILQVNDDVPYTKEAFLADVKKLTPEVMADPATAVMT